MFFDCRACTEDICQKFMPLSGDTRRRSSRVSSKRNPASFQPRPTDKIAELVANWEQYVHPRGRDFFQTDERLRETLSTVIKNINATDDPVLGNAQCVFWYGPTNRESGSEQAILELNKAESTPRAPTFVNRLLSFVFATDESFARLMKLPKVPFRMSCGDQLCVNIKHISD